jgi:hypothetical protein
MAEAGTLHDAFIDELRDTYDAEEQLTKALAKLAKASSNPKLRAAFETHLEETQGQIERLEQVFESLDALERDRSSHVGELTIGPPYQYPIAGLVSGQIVCAGADPDRGGEAFPLG